MPKCRPGAASWITGNFAVEAHPIAELGMLGATDRIIFDAAREAGAVIVTKDNDFAQMVKRMGPPPQILWITCGNTSNARLREVLQTALPAAFDLLEHGEPLVEISNAL
jgi:predicted nuclease of predicted toxin-antitoxin system